MESVIALSKIDGDVMAIVGSYACPMKNQVYTYKVRGVVVQKLPHWTKEEKGHKFQLCVFPDFSQRWVNVENLRGFKLNKFAGGTQ